ncbi:YkgJ family cysteine cluster protein [Planctomicrobium sp. SH661]|uniref:YkgJ family cysteine cluster protein n=1 Tax=Planctomicrobium sp. SH661 TaxID=3448124 RepID=UPI003F5C4372
MSHFPLQLPTIQNWSCHNCGGCCREHAITISPEERARIEGQKWTPADGIAAGQPLFVEERNWLGQKTTRLAHQPDGACVFLNDKGLCRIHAKFGEAAKPLACRIYPYAFHPGSRQLTVSLRFSCPSVAANRGQSLLQQKRELQQLAGLVVPEQFRDSPPPSLTSRTRLDWADTMQVVELLDLTMAEEGTAVVVKLLRAIFWLDLVAQSKLKKIRGERFQELLTLLYEASRSEIEEVPEELGTPSKIGLTQFRLLAGQYARKDTAASIDTSLKGRWRQFQNAMRLARGVGNLPQLQDQLAEVSFSLLEEVPVTLTAESEEMLTRYFRVKIQGLSFCGPAYYHVPVVEGFYSLSLVYPVVLWIARWLAASRVRCADHRKDVTLKNGPHSGPCVSVTHEDVLTALTIVDHQHGYSPALGHWPARRRVKNLAANGDLQKLIAR